MASAGDLPVEVWRTILQLVPLECGTQLLAVNRTFFQIIIARRYERIYWDYSWFGSMKRNVHALKYVSRSILYNEQH